MHSLTAADVIRIWEFGHRQKPVERTVTVLSASFPERSQEALWRLTLGQCNDLLLEVRDQLCGQELKGYSECPNCGERLEFTLNSKTLRRAKPVAPPNAEFTLESFGCSVRFRLLDNEDLKAAGDCGNVSAARNRLVERCILEARCGDRTIPVGTLPETVVEDLARHLAECDGGAEILVDLSCPACEYIHQ
jgi:hypothetical protein